METALITGASSGIGKEFAYIFARHGIRPVLVARREKLLQEIAADIENLYQIKCIVYVADLTQNDQINTMISTFKDSKIEIDYLINNAGFGLLGAFNTLDWDKQNQMIDLNIKTLTHLTYLLLPGMIAKKSGRILNVASTAAFQPGPKMAVYFATKAYVLSFSEALAVELSKTGVSVTALCPGPTMSEFASTAGVKEGMMFNKSIPDAKSVANYGFRMMMKNKTVAVHGFKNQLLSLFLIRITPRSLVTRMVNFMTNH